MCGICGIYGSNQPGKTLNMLNRLLHRGPDGEKIEQFPWGTLGFCRLDIFGSDGVNQPVISLDNKTAVVFNGEIYNFDELKLLVQSEEPVIDEAHLILGLYLRYGEACFQKLKGMFAIAIMTPHKLILARDSMGIKPLVYFTDKNRMYFASEIKALLAAMDGPAKISDEAMAESAVFGFIFDLEKTMFQGVKQVPPGAYLVFQEEKLKITKYYESMPAFYGQQIWKDKDTTDHFIDCMETASRLHIDHSKHSQAVYLSGGIDSTLMAYFLNKNASTPLDTYTLFDDKNSEDRIYAAKVANQVGTNHVEVESDADECMSFLDHYLFHYESLVTDGIFNVLGSLAFHLLSCQIAKKHKVAYCGEGADELFGGYYWLHAHPLGLGDRLRARSAKVNFGRTHIHDYIMDKFPDDDSKEDSMKKEIFDFLMGPGLTNCHLWSVDRSSSAFSFEARPLYLYDSIRDWALSLSIENKVSKDRATKMVMKKYAQNTGDSLMQQVAARKKIGMPSALTKSLNQLLISSGKQFKKDKGKKDLPHHEYSSYLHTDLEKLMFDRFYEIFIINKGSLPQSSLQGVPD